MPSLKYRPDIDGLRAIAILGVLFFHAGLGFPGGYVGVDIFFVISGFLITSLILRDLKNGCFSILDFWERRARRILPALAVVTAFTLIVGYFILLPLDYKALGTAVLALAGLSSNIMFWRETGYFEAAADQKPLLHTWSLSLEEQFYLLIPILLWVLFRFGKSNWVFRVLLVGGLASLALSVYGTYAAPDATFFLLPARAWELGAGSLLAFATPIASPRLRSAMSWLGLLAIAVPFFAYTSETRFPGLAAVPPVLGSALLIWTGMRISESQEISKVQRFLGSRPMVWIGLISYSLYLWHWPLLAFHRYLGIMQTGAIRGGLVAVALLLAWLSLVYVERPFRRRTLVSSRRSVFALSAVTVLILVIPSMLLWRTTGLPGRLSPRARQLAAGATDSAFTNELSMADIPKNFVPFGKPGVAPSVFVWGDSHAMAMLPAVDAACRQSEKAGLAATRSSTAPVLDWFRVTRFGLGPAAPAYNRAIMDYLKSPPARKTIRHVILAARWRGYLKCRDNRVPVQTALADTVRELQQCGYSVAVFQEVPSWSTEVPKALALQEMLGWEMLKPSLSQNGADSSGRPRDTILADLKSSARPVHVIDPFPYLTGEDGRVLTADAGGAIFRDSHHLSIHGALRLQPAFVKLLTSEPSSASNGP